MSKAVFRIRIDLLVGTVATAVQVLGSPLRTPVLRLTKLHDAIQDRIGNVDVTSCIHGHEMRFSELIGSFAISPAGNRDEFARVSVHLH